MVEAEARGVGLTERAQLLSWGETALLPLQGTEQLRCLPVGSWYPGAFPPPPLQDPSKVWEGEAPSHVSFPERQLNMFLPHFGEEEEGHWEVMACSGLRRMSAGELERGPTL